MTSGDLDDLLDGTDSAPPSTERPAIAPEATRETAPEPTGVKEGSAPPAEATDQQSEPDLLPRKVVLDERRKRQELEKRVKEYEEQIAQFQQPKQEPQPAPDWDLDPRQAAENLQRQFETRAYQQAVYVSERVMRAEREDYDEVSAVFAEAAKKDPRLLQSVLSHPFPAEFAYKEGRRLKLLQDIGDDPDEFINRQVEARLAARQGSQPEPTQKQKPPQVPRSLARDVSQQPRNARGQFDGPASLDEILG